MFPSFAPFPLNPDFITKSYYPRTYSPSSTGYYPEQPANQDLSLRVRLVPNWWNGLTVEIYPAPGSNYQSFGIYYSVSETGPFKLITPGYITGYAYTFTGNNVNLKYNQPFIFVEAQGPDGVFVSPMVTTFNQRNLALVQNAALDITRREWVFLRKFAGVPSLIYKRRVSGKRCPVCWDYKYQKMMTDHCDNCYNTSFEGGYYNPVYTLAQYDPLSKVEVEMEFGKSEPSRLTAWTTNFPVISPRDLIYRIPDGRMLLVEAIDNTELQSTVVRQILTISELDKEMIEYHLTLNLPSMNYLSALMSRQNPWLNPTNDAAVNATEFQGNTLDINAVGVM
jgi:hypothetical protein